MIKSYFKDIFQEISLPYIIFLFIFLCIHLYTTVIFYFYIFVFFSSPKLDPHTSRQYINQKNLEIFQYK